MTWGDWSFGWTISDKAEGLGLRDVKFKGVQVIHKASMPAVRVKYRGGGGSVGSGCGPYIDQLEWDNMEIISGAGSEVTLRIFDGNVLEIAVFAEIGGYDLFQAWYLHKSGRLQPMLHSSGWSCCDDEHENDHKHHPYWRIDFDVEGINNEIWQITNNGQPLLRAVEADTKRLSTNTSVGWTINKPGSNKHVLIRYPTNEIRDKSGTPWFSFSNKDAAWRRYRYAEDEGWDFDKYEHLGYKNTAESTDGKDIVFWTVGHLTHTWSQSDENNPQWHSSGPIIDVVNF
jgi:hypothetical protein